MIPYTGTPASWNELAASLPLAHLLQTWEWSQVKSKYGWQALPFFWQDEMGKPVAAAMVLKRSLPVRRVCKKYVRALHPERSAHELGGCQPAATGAG